MIRQLVSLLLFFFILWSYPVNADVEFTEPKADATIKGGSVISIKWKDSGDSPKISSLINYEIFLCAGGNDAADYVGDPKDCNAKVLDTLLTQQ